MLHRYLVPGRGVWVASLGLMLSSGCTGSEDASEDGLGVGGETTAGVGGGSTGGASPTGGAMDNGGALAGSGGSTPTAGTAPGGGTDPAGGATPTGGAAAAGTMATGGLAPTGGVENTGGMDDTGGLQNTGGLDNTGGQDAAGGSGNAGGAENTGGAPSTGGTLGSGTAIDHGVSLIGYGAGTTGGDGHPEVTVSSLAELENALGSNVKIRVSGTISGSGMISIKDVSNISIVGVGTNGRFQGIGLSFVRTSNIIIQNLTFQNASEDAINIENTVGAWVDHNTMSTDIAYLDCDQSSVKDKYDGQIDIKKNSQNITVSYNHVHDACKAMLLGFSDGKEPDDRVTYHHNHFENIGSRLPLIRSASTHVFNNYYQNVSISGINVRMGANALIENNFFDTVDDPILSADSDEIGYWNVSGNIYVPDGPSYTHKIEDVDVIGTVVDGEVQSTCDFTVDYGYELDDAIDVPPTTIAYAGAGKI